MEHMRLKIDKASLAKRKGTTMKLRKAFSLQKGKLRKVVLR